MTPHAHNTDAPLHHHRCPIECTVFNTDYSYAAQKIGHNAQGLCFESTSAFHKGTMLKIRLENYSTRDLDEEAWDGLRTLSVGEVTWCRPTQEDDALGTIYNVGVKYYDPAW
jgi:hypothetical protein